MFRFFRSQDKQNTDRAVVKTRQTWFGKMAGLFQRSRLDDDLWDDLEELLISADVGVSTSSMLLERLKQSVRDEGIGEPAKALTVLKREMVSILNIQGADDGLALGDTPLVILMVGVNGVGKTTSVAKLAHWYAERDMKVLVGAADTFRAAAIDQLQAWGRRLEFDVIAHQPGADPGAITFDSLEAAHARHADVVIIDTAGRLHTNANLMEELKKIRRVVSRHEGSGTQRVLLTLDATTGQNGVIQARSFIDAVEVDGVFLAKLDGTARGGGVLAIADELKLPVLYIGTGEQADDIALFNPQGFVDSLFASDEED